MPSYTGRVKRPKGSISARVIKANGRIVDLGTIAGEGLHDPKNLEKGRKGRELLNKLINKEEHNG